MTSRACIQLLLALGVGSTVLAMDHPPEKPQFLIQKDVALPVNENSDEEWFKWIKKVGTLKADDGTKFKLIRSKEGLVMFDQENDKTGLHFTIDQIRRTSVEFHATIRLTEGQEFHVGYKYTEGQKLELSEWEKSGMIKKRDSKGDPIVKSGNKINADRNGLKLAAHWADLYAVPEKFGKAVITAIKNQAHMQYMTEAMIKASNETGYHKSTN